VIDTVRRAEADDAVLEWGNALRWAVLREDRARLDATLFDVQRRQIIGYEGYFALAGELVRELEAAGVTPAIAGAEMRHVMTRPYQLQIFELIINPLLAREQRILQGLSVAEFDAMELLHIAPYASALMREYRRDSAFGPTRGNNERQQILEETEVERCLDSLTPVRAGDVVKLRRTLGTIGLYSVLLHGEHRDGIFDHGPYPGPSDTHLLVSEVNDLANEYLPWSTEPVRLSVSGVAVVYDHRDVQLDFGLFGEVATDPIDFTDRATEAGVLARRNGEVVALSATELEELAAEARSATKKLYGDVMVWEPAERVLYGTHLYANHFRAFTEMLDRHGGGGRGIELLRRFEEVGDRVGTEVVGNPVPTIARYQAEEANDSARPYFSPLTV
jgi:hypothetical protein